MTDTNSDPEASNRSNQTSDSDEYSEFQIQLATICREEVMAYNDPEHMQWKKVPGSRLDELESVAQMVLVKNSKPTVDYSEDMKKYLTERFDKQFSSTQFEPTPFHHGYFVLAYNSPLPEPKDRYIYFGGQHYYYMFSYDTPVIVKRPLTEDQRITKEQFELLFAFALRQCDIMKVDQFLDFHLAENFDTDLSIFYPYLNQLTRKYSSTLFSEPLTDTVRDWLKRNQPPPLESSNKKIKTHLTVHSLCYLFKALSDAHLIEAKYDTEIVRLIQQQFESKQAINLSFKSVHNKYTTPDDSAVEFWIDQFKRLSARAEIQLKKNLK